MAKKASSHLSHTILVLLVAIGLVGTVIWLVVRMDLDLTSAAAVVTVGLAICGGLYVWAERMGEGNALNNDRELLIAPVLANYRDDHNKKRLLREYDKWSSADRDPQLRYEFLRQIIQALVDDRHNTEAGMRLDELEALAPTDELRADAREFRAAIEEQIRRNQAEREAEREAAEKGDEA